MTLPLQRSTTSDLEGSVADALPWLQEAVQPYFDWIFGSSAGARQSPDRWMRRPSSEVAISRVTPLLVGGRHIGRFIAMGGTELAGCRKADVIAFLQEARNRGTGGLWPLARTSSI